MAAELLKRIWIPEIQNQLFPSGSFLQRSIVDDAYVNANTVELAHSGTIPAVTVDRAILPATIAKRTDVATNYTLEELTTDPTNIQYSEELLVSYPKRQSILSQHMLSLQTRFGTRALYKWAAGADSTRIAASTGSTRAAGNTNGSQTGNRKKFTEADIQGMLKFFYGDNIQTDIGDINGIAVITPAQYMDLLGISNFTLQYAYGTANIPSGVIKRAYGFDFYVRNPVVVLNSSNALKAEGAAGAADDQDCAVFYSAQYVRRAVGSIIPFIRLNDPTFYGDIFSMLVRFGAAPARNDNKGVYLLYESN